MTKQAKTPRVMPEKDSSFRGIFIDKHRLLSDLMEYGFSNDQIHKILFIIEYNFPLIAFPTVLDVTTAGYAKITSIEPHSAKDKGEVYLEMDGLDSNVVTKVEIPDIARPEYMKSKIYSIASLFTIASPTFTPDKVATELADDFEFLRNRHPTGADHPWHLKLLTLLLRARCHIF